MTYNLITILGPTAVGKTFLAARLAKEFNGEIISADSRQVYTGMDIGTGKDLDDYEFDDTIIPHYLIDIIDPSEEFNLFLFQKYFFEYYSQITSKNKLSFLVGGTGLYIHSLLKEYELLKVDFNADRIEELDKYSIEELQKRLLELSPSLHNTTDLLIKERVIKGIIIAEQKSQQEESDTPKLNSLVIGVTMERDEIKKRITLRLKQRLESGMIEEAEGLLKSGVTHEKLAFFGLEYKFVSQYLKGELNKNDMFQKLNSAIHKFAKRQMTWFRKMEREGIEIHWVQGPDFETAKEIIETKYFGSGLQS